MPSPFRICPRCDKWSFFKRLDCKKCGLHIDGCDYEFWCGGNFLTVCMYRNKTIIGQSVFEGEFDYAISLKITEDDLYKLLVLQ